MNLGGFILSKQTYSSPSLNYWQLYCFLARKCSRIQWKFKLRLWKSFLGIPFMDVQNASCVVLSAWNSKFDERVRGDPWSLFNNHFHLRARCTTRNGCGDAMGYQLGAKHRSRHLLVDVQRRSQIVYPSISKHTVCKNFVLVKCYAHLKPLQTVNIWWKKMLYSWPFCFQSWLYSFFLSKFSALPNVQYIHESL